jgi:hypothetical protein
LKLNEVKLSEYESMITELKEENRGLNSDKDTLNNKIHSITNEKIEEYISIPYLVTQLYLTKA